MAKSTKKSRRHKNGQGKEDQKPAFFSKSNDTATNQQPFFQTKLTIGKPGDKYEQEADAVADSVVNHSANKPAVQQKEISSIQRATLATPPEYEKLGTAEGKMEEDKMIQEMPAAEGAKEEEPAIQEMHDPADKEEPQAQMKEEEEPQAQMKEEEEPQAQMKEEEEPQAKMKEEEESTGALQTKSTTATNPTASNQVSQTITQKKGRGAKLPDKTRTEMETAFGKDLSKVRIHTDMDSIEMNQKLKAQAFTTGKDVFFNAGKYNPETTDGKRLLAHELTHVVQQKGADLKKKSQTQKPSTPVAKTKSCPNVKVTIATPKKIPLPDYSQTDKDLKAWEKAIFHFQPMFIPDCEQIDLNGIPHSFVKNITFGFQKSRYSFFIAKHIKDNIDNASNAGNLQLANIWRSINRRIIIHSRTHFKKYERVVHKMKIEIHNELCGLPAKGNPIPISKSNLEKHIINLMQHLTGKLRFELWKTTCDWEKEDYPRLFKKLPVSATLKPSCGTAPKIPPKPILPIVVKGKKQIKGKPNKKK